MPSKFRHVALIGKYQAVASGSSGASSRRALEGIGHFLHNHGCEVAFETQTAANMGITGHATLDVEGIGRQCDLGLVVGGDGTMLGIGRQLARSGVPLIGINQGRLGFITDIPLEDFESTLLPMLSGDYEEDL
ncbi:MAG: NAD(+)/NADH kinase, partial [Burkholderiaceae bacterium]